jgi:hypothetical protein
MVLVSKTWVLEVAESGPAFGESPPYHPWALPIVKHEVNITTPLTNIKTFLIHIRRCTKEQGLYTHFLRLRGILHQNLFPILNEGGRHKIPPLF